MKLDPHVQRLGVLPDEMRELLLDAARSVDLDDPASLTKEEAFFDACNRYDAETEFFHTKNNFYSGVLPRADLTARLQPYYEFLLSTYFPGHAIFRSQIVRNIPGAIVNPHIDPRLYHRKSHRVHAVLFTNDRAGHVYFDPKNGYEAEYHKMEAGFIFDFDNITPHAAFNLGSTGRLHSIIDIMPPLDYQRFKPILLLDPNRIPAGVGVEYYEHLNAIETKYNGKDGLRQEYERHLRT